MESLPSLSVSDVGLLVQAADAEDRRLRLSDDRHSELLAEDARVGQRKCAARDLIRRELLVARALGKIHNRARNAEEVLLLGLLDHRNDQSPVQRDRDADVDVLVVPNRFALHRCIDDRDASAAPTIAARVMNGM